MKKSKLVMKMNLADSKTFGLFGPLEVTVVVNGNFNSEDKNVRTTFEDAFWRAVLPVARSKMKELKEIQKENRTNLKKADRI